MFYVAYCGDIVFGDSEESVDAIMRDSIAKIGIQGSTIAYFENPLDLIDIAVNPKSAATVDVVVCGTGIPGISMIDLAKDIRKENAKTRIIFCDVAPADAYEALDMHIDACLSAPMLLSRFQDVFERLISSEAMRHEHSLLMRVKGGIQRIYLPDVLYAETIDHDQVIHMVDGSELRTRMSSQNLFEMLVSDGRFFKAGSSYILNTRMIRSVNALDSSARMFGGATVNVPTRLRKSLENAILNNN